MRLASSWMVITSGMITSRMTLSRGCTTPAWRSFSRSRRRLQRGQRTLALRLVEGVVDGELDALAPLVADLDRALGRLGALLLVRAIPPPPRPRPREHAPHAWRSARRAGRLGTLGFSAGAPWPRRPPSRPARSALDRLGLRLRHGRSRAPPSRRAPARAWAAAPPGERARALPPRRAPSPLRARAGAHRARRWRGRQAAASPRPAGAPPPPASPSPAVAAGSRRWCASSSSRPPPTSSGHG